MWPDWAIYCTLGNFSKPTATIIFPKLPTFLGSLRNPTFCLWNHFGQHPRFQLWQPEFASHWSLHFYSVQLCEKNQFKSSGMAHYKKNKYPIAAFVDDFDCRWCYLPRVIKFEIFGQISVHTLLAIFPFGDLFQAAPFWKMFLFHFCFKMM